MSSLKLAKIGLDIDKKLFPTNQNDLVYNESGNVVLKDRLQSSMPKIKITQRPRIPDPTQEHAIDKPTYATTEAGISDTARQLLSR